MADIFDVIADGTRRDLLKVLLAQRAMLDTDGQAGTANGEISVGQIVERMGLSQPTVSKHLKVLRDHGLVTVREDGQHRYYRLDTAPLEEVEDWLVPLLSAELLDERTGGSDDPRSAAVFAAWSGADVGESIGRRLAEGSHQARSVISEAGEVVTTLPRKLQKRLFNRD
ncbi:MAG: metalloregulator ArsR/SmtB family transcription factor [Gemmatimonadota bacterium]|nr:metalloregulator ArsR/SmtB family transcription factor [Gemmatimonadota bacterium]